MKLSITRLADCTEGKLSNPLAAIVFLVRRFLEFAEFMEFSWKFMCETIRRQFFVHVCCYCINCTTVNLEEGMFCIFSSI